MATTLKRCPVCSAEVPPGATHCAGCGKPLSSEPDPWLGKVLFGKYRCLERIGAGTTALVYKVQHAKLASFRAMKILRGELRSDTKAVESFWREVRVAASLRHLNIAMLHDADSLPDATPCSIWDWVDGPSLEEKVKKMPLGPDTATVVRGLCGALEALHDRAIAHLDICPQNVLLPSDDDSLEPRLVDFGEARKFGMPAERSIEELRLGFSAPEQVAGADSIDARADIFAMGAMICFAFTGSPPLAPKDLKSYAEELRRLDPRKLKVLDKLPPPLRAVVERCLSLDPAQRPANAAALREAIRRAARDPGAPGATSQDASQTLPRPSDASQQLPRPSEARASQPRPVEPLAPKPRAADASSHHPRTPDTAAPERAVIPFPGTNEAPPVTKSAGTPPGGSPIAVAPAAEVPRAPHAGTLEFPRAAKPAAPPPVSAQLLETMPPPARGHGPLPRAVLEPFEGAGRKPIELGELNTIGRGDGNTVVLDYPAVSKRHARILYHDGAFVLEDLGSRNGCIVNGRLVGDPTPLRDGDRVAFGDVLYHFRLPK